MKGLYNRDCACATDSLFSATECVAQLRYSSIRSPWASWPHLTVRPPDGVARPDVLDVPHHEPSCDPKGLVIGTGTAPGISRRLLRPSTAACASAAQQHAARFLNFYEAPNGPAVKLENIEDEWYNRQRPKLSLLDKSPWTQADTWIAPNAVVAGDVDIYDQVMYTSSTCLKSVGFSRGAISITIGHGASLSGHLPRSAGRHLLRRGAAWRPE
eukprot:364807-Chlamydomonas_euryale.AAC.7